MCNKILPIIVNLKGKFGFSLDLSNQILPANVKIFRINLSLDLDTDPYEDNSNNVGVRVPVWTRLA